jgi:hypothetical protein
MPQRGGWNASCWFVYSCGQEVSTDCGRLEEVSAQREVGSAQISMSFVARVHSGVIEAETYDGSEAAETDSSAQKKGVFTFDSVVSGAATIHRVPRIKSNGIANDSGDSRDS